MKNKILKLALAVWITIWAFFIFRELLIKGRLFDYRVLLFRSLEGKRSYVTGDKFYEFLTFCKHNLPGSAAYDLIVLKGGDIEIDKRRAVYYLYPNLRKSDPEFILIYDELAVEKIRNGPFITLEEDGFIGTREGARGKRIDYYLYPDPKKGNSDFILIYNKPNAPKIEYRIFIKLDDNKYILRKKKM